MIHRQSGSLDFEIWHLIGLPRRAGSWGQVVKRSSLHIVLNRVGEGLVIDAETRLTLLPQTTALFSTTSLEGLCSATRFASGSGHDFLVLVMSSSSVERIFGPIGPQIRKNLGIIRRWADRESDLVADLVNLPVQSDASRAWYLAKALEILSLHLFRQPESEPRFFCSMVKSGAHRYVQEALNLLEGRFDEPLNLKKLAQDVGCAAHYLSRLVKKETGKTLSLHLRAIRIERAAEQLSGNQMNVTEVALEVGYQSLSHFSKAFAEEKGMTPSQFLKRQR